MFSKIISATAVALAASTLVSAQTFTVCDPTKKDCPPDPALGTTVDIDLTKGEPKDVFENLAGTKVEYDGSKGGVFSIKGEGDSPTMASHKYIFFGRIDVTMQAAPGAGIVTSFVLQSDDLDEIDLEWVGGDNAQVQSNYFSKGDTSTYDRGAYHPVGNPTGQFHTYSIDWTKDYVQWIVDGAVVRTLTYNDAKGGSSFPQTPMQIKFGTWVAGRKDAPKGTVDWAGGYTNFADGPFVAYYKDIKITDYAGGVSGAKQYIYSDRSGTWQSIKIDTVNGGEAPKPPVESSSSAAPTAKPSTTASPTESAETQSVTSTTSTVPTTLSTITSSASPSGSGSANPSQPLSFAPPPQPSNTNTAAPITPNAAGQLSLTFGNVAVALGALFVVNMFVL